jgi:chemotaxis protein MotB
MRTFIDPADDSEGTNYRLPVSNILASALLLLLAMFFLAAVPQRKGEYKVPLPEQTNQEQAHEVASNVMPSVRKDIINELTEKLSAINLPVEINKTTGNIRFTEAVLFNINMDTLNADGKKNLEIFVPIYLSVLLDDKYEAQLDQIIIEGHADNGGTYVYNLDLSQKRANSVMEFILSQKLMSMPDGTSAEKYFTVSARSFNVPVLVDGKPDKSQSRRVEFAFQLKNDENSGKN